MKFKGGYDIVLAGRPSRRVDSLPDPETLYLPLYSRRFDFSEIRVEEGRQVYPGQILAVDPKNHSVPLLAPRAGTVRLNAVENHIVLERIFKVPEQPYDEERIPAHAPARKGSSGMLRFKLLQLGAWQFFADACTGELPDPFATPQAVIVSMMRLDPFETRGDVQIRKRMSEFKRGLEQLQSLLEYQPIYLVFPDVQTAFARRVREQLRGYAFIRIVLLPLKYPADNFELLVRRLGLKRDREAPVWALSVAGVLAVDRALTSLLPSTVRIISLGGPEVEEPRHLKVMPGYPLKDILKSHFDNKGIRVVNGGVMTGEALRPDQLGVDAECAGLTVLAEHSRRELLGFLRPGADRRSYGRCFLSSLRSVLPQKLDTALRGELRPCISCGYCEEVCPARIMPHLIHKALYRDELDEAEKLRIDLCVRCGLCSYVCPSKIDLREQFERARMTIREELAQTEEEAIADEELA